MAVLTVFISYRREDSAGYAGRLFDRLADQLGRANVFRDVEGLAPGDDFAESLLQRLAAAQILLVIIGPRWLTATSDTGQNRLEDPSDLVRREIELGLERKLRILPVLLPATSMPKAKDMPLQLAPLAQLNAAELRDVYFDHDVDELLKAIGGKRDRGLFRLSKARYFRQSAIFCGFILALLLLYWSSEQPLRTRESARLRLSKLV